MEAIAAGIGISIFGERGVTRTRRADIIASFGLLALPFTALWRLWTRNPFDRAFIWQDVTDTAYPFLVFLRDSVVIYGEAPKWTWGIYSGIPFSANFLNFITYPLCWPLFTILDPARQGVFHLQLIAHISIAGAGFYWFARTFHLRPVTAFLGACLYAFNGFTCYMLLVGNAWAIAFAWFPVVLLCVRRFVVTRRILWAMLTSLALFLMIASLNPLNVIPLLLFTVVFFASSLHVENAPSRTALSAWFALAILLALGMHTRELLPLAEMSRVGQAFGSTSFLYARDKWVPHTFVHFISGFFLGGESANEHVGKIAAIAVIFGLWLRRGRYWALWALTFVVCIFAFAVSSDLALYDLFYLFVPTVKSLPNLERGGAAFLINLAAAFLAMSMFRNVAAIRRIAPSSSISVLVVVLAFLWFCARPDDAASQPRFQHSFVAFATLAGLMLMFANGLRAPRRRGLVLAMMGVTIALSTVSIVSRDFEPRLTPLEDRDKPPLKSAAPDSAEETIMSSPYLRWRTIGPKLPSMVESRVNKARNNVLLIQGPDNVGGYYPWIPRRAAQAFSASGFLDAYLFQAPHTIDRITRWPAAAVPKLYDLKPAEAGRAWLVPRTLAVEAAPFDGMAAPDFDPYTTCFVEEERKVTRSEFGSLFAAIERALDWWISSDRPVPESRLSHRMNAGVTLVRQTPNSAAFRLERDVHAETLFFSDNWYPGWAAYVNGKRVPLLVANYTFKAVRITAPRSSIVEFVFNPPLAGLANVVSVLCAIAALTLGIATVRMTVPKPATA